MATVLSSTPRQGPAPAPLGSTANMPITLPVASMPTAPERKARKPRTVTPKPFVIQSRPVQAGVDNVWSDNNLPDGAVIEDTADAWALIVSSSMFPFGQQYRVVQVCGSYQEKKEEVVKKATLG